MEKEVRERDKSEGKSQKKKIKRWKAETPLKDVLVFKLALRPRDKLVDVRLKRGERSITAEARLLFFPVLEESDGGI